MNVRKVISITGLVIFFIGLFMLPSVVVGLFYNDGSARYLMAAAAISMSSGFLVFLSNRSYRGNDISNREGFAIVAFSWFFAAASSALPYYIGGEIPNFGLSFFEAASGLTTTGATVLQDIEKVPQGLLFWRACTHWIGGMGIILLSVAILPFFGFGGMQLYKAESAGPTKDKLVPRIRETAKLLWGLYVLISLSCFLLLMLFGMNGFEAACHTMACISTGGFSIYNQSIGSFNSPLIEYTITFFMVISGVNFSLHYLALTGKFKEYFRSEELRLYVFLLLFSTLVIYLSRLDAQLPAEQNFRESWFQVASIMTCTGFMTADFEHWRPIAQLMLLLCMIWGGCAGSTSGGLKVIRALLLGKYFMRLLIQQLHPKAVVVVKLDGNPIAANIMRNILGFFCFYMVTLLAGTGLVAANGIDLLSSFSAVATCMAGAGPGLGIVGPTDNFSVIPLPGIWVLNVVMLMGRLEMFSILVLFMPKIWQK